MQALLPFPVLLLPFPALLPEHPAELANRLKKSFDHPCHLKYTPPLRDVLQL